MIVGALVDQFIMEKEQIAPDDLARLEKEVVLALDAKKVAISGSSTSKLAKAGAAAMGSDMGGPSTNDGPGSNAHSMAQSEASSKSTPPPPGSEWAVIQAYQILQGEEKTRQEKEIEKNKKREFRAALDAHMAEAAAFKANHSDVADQQYFQHVKNDIQAYHDEEKAKFDKIHEKAKIQLRIQNEQIAEKQKRRAKELEQEREAEEQMLADARQKIVDEQNKMERIRAVAKENQEKVNRENQENERLRAIQAQKDADEDRRLQAEYAAKLDREDEERENAFKNRMEKMAAFSAKSAEEGAGFKARQKELEVERLLLKNQAEKEARDKAAEEKKARDKKIRLQRMLAENEKILARKAREAESLRKIDADYANAALADVKKYKAEEQAKVDKVKAHYVKYRQVLDEQMKSRTPAADPTSAAFLGREAELNGSLFQKAAHDPKVLKLLEPKPKVQQVKVVTHK